MQESENNFLETVKVLDKAGLTLGFAEGRRLINNGAVFLNDKPLGLAMPIPKPGDVLRVGKRKSFTF